MSKEGSQRNNIARGLKATQQLLAYHSQRLPSFLSLSHVITHMWQFSAKTLKGVITGDPDDMLQVNIKLSGHLLCNIRCRTKGNVCHSTLGKQKSKKMYPPLSIVNKNVPPSFTWFWKLCSPFTLPSCNIINDRFLKCVIYLNVAIFTGSRNLPMQLFEKYWCCPMDTSKC